MTMKQQKYPLWLEKGSPVSSRRPQDPRKSMFSIRRVSQFKVSVYKTKDKYYCVRRIIDNITETS
ncbi:hypothetical protein V1478_012364 [Vespula squamosa]|uniref:Uncharacterized protein n=1 Tax=Vespula squamosa TaxID=30214 RepID=A0ABD2ACY9_VESSQ